MPRRLLTLAVGGAGTLAGAMACARHSSAGAAAAARPDSVQVGYGAQPADKTTGARTTLDAKDFGIRPTNVAMLLRGKVAGLEVIQNGNDVTFRIRGGTSMTGVTQEPLVVVDGVALQQGNVANALAGLTPDDIRQVNVLKDVASTSVYGVRGAGGVIIITTKRKIDQLDA